MPLTDTDTTWRTASATVAVRIPSSADADLVTHAERRLGRIEGIETATVDDLEGLDPGLSATVVTVAVTVEYERTVDALHDRLATAVGVTVVEGLDAEEPR